jgi:SMC interacting uncharacterized protein involved in chromosome segregation
MILEYERVKRELEQMREMKEKYEELRKTHEKLQVENEEVRKIVGDMCVCSAYTRCMHVGMPQAVSAVDRYVSIDEDCEIREKYIATYKQVRIHLMLIATRSHC